MHLEADREPEAALNREFDPRTDSVVDEVLAAVSRVGDVDLTNCAPLAEVVDPDALEELFDPVRGGLAQTAGHVSFVYEGLEVVISAEGVIRVFGESHLG